MVLILTKSGRSIAQVCCTIDSDLKETAKREKINMSALLTRALKEELGDIIAKI